MKEKARRLVVAPHADDEVFWCYSVLKNSRVIVLGTRNPNNEAVSRRIAKELGYEMIYLNHPDCNYGSRFDLIKKEIEDIVAQMILEEVYYPCLTHHQDHNVVNQIMKIIVRPMRIPTIRKICEYPYWDMTEFEFNLVHGVNPKKFSHVGMFGEKVWTDYVTAYNEYIGKKLSLNGRYEAFKQVYAMVDEL